MPGPTPKELVLNSIGTRDSAASSWPRHACRTTPQPVSSLCLHPRTAQLDGSVRLHSVAFVQLQQSYCSLLRAHRAIRAGSVQGRWGHTPLLASTIEGCCKQLVQFMHTLSCTCLLMRRLLGNEKARHRQQPHACAHLLQCTRASEKRGRYHLERGAAGRAPHGACRSKGLPRIQGVVPQGRGAAQRMAIQRLHFGLHLRGGLCSTHTVPLEKKHLTNHTQPQR